MLEVGVWVDLIFIPYLNLDDLIHVKRTCATFCFYPRFQKLIEKKIKEHFGDIPQHCWNKVGEFKVQKVDKIRFFIDFIHMSVKYAKFGVFSTKERLLENCENYIQKFCFFERLRHIQIIENYITFREEGMFVKIYGINDIIINIIKTNLKNLIAQRGINRLVKCKEGDFELTFLNDIYKFKEPFAEEKMFDKLQTISKLNPLCFVHYIIINDTVYCKLKK